MRGKRLSSGLRAVAALFAATLFVTNAWAASQEKVLHTFNPMPDGAEPYAGLTLDAVGNLYGTTYTGGTYGAGTVFELTPVRGSGRLVNLWTRKVLFNFKNDDAGTTGAFPYAGLIIDAAGNLYGTTYSGGTYHGGTVFELMLQAGGGWTETVLHNFNFNGADGYNPYAGLTFDAAGNLYGTTVGGGTYNYGTVFELTPQAGGGWTETVLYSFGNGTDGQNPYAGLIFDKNGNLYGTTVGGGTYTYGTVFELTPQAGGGWTEKVLYSFGNGTDGHNPGGLIMDAAGNLYGTTNRGGTYGAGTVFELTPQAGGGWTETVLYSFGNGTDGADPLGGLIFDAAGDLYGTTSRGGTYGGGMVFELTPQAGGGWKEKVLHGFGNGPDGAGPLAGVIFDATGNLYGTTYEAGAYAQGTVFELTLGLTRHVGLDWTETVLHDFSLNGPDGAFPYGSLIFDAAGNLYGTTYEAGASSVGAVFELTPEAGGGWTETVLHNFNFNGADGQNPYAGLTLDAAGNLYGTTVVGGTYNYGTVFELTPQAGGGWTEKVLYSFGNGTDGAKPLAGLIFDASGNLYGTTDQGGTSGFGTVFELTPQAGGGWTEKVLYSFGNGTDGANPLASLIFDGAGDLYGTTQNGGTYGGGMVFELTPQAGGVWTEKVLYSFGNGTDGAYPYAGLIFDKTAISTAQPGTAALPAPGRCSS